MNFKGEKTALWRLPLWVSLELISQMTQTNDSTVHVQMPAPPECLWGRGWVINSSKPCLSVHSDWTLLLLLNSYLYVCRIILTLSAHVRRGHPHIYQAAVIVQMDHGVWSHGFIWVAPAAMGVVHHIPFCLKVHHCSNTQFMLQLDSHMFYLSWTAAQPNPWQHPGGNEQGWFKKNHT